MGTPMRYLKPGENPMEVEHLPRPPGCLRYLIVGAALIGLAVGFALATASHPGAAAPVPVTRIQIITSTPGPSPTITRTPRSSPTPSPTPTGTLAPTQTTVPATATACITVHTVLKGGTLYWIARAFHTTTQAIQAASGLGNVDKIYAGQKIKIPCTATP